MSSIPYTYFANKIWFHFVLFKAPKQYAYQIIFEFNEWSTRNLALDQPRTKSSLVFVIDDNVDPGFYF